MKKKYFFLVLIFALNMALTACGIEESRFFRKTSKIGFLSDVGVYKENNFNEQSYKGVLRAKEDFPLKVEALENTSKDSIEKKLKSLANKNNVVIVAGEGLNSAVDKVSKDYSNKIFAIIDGKSNNENVKTVRFKEQEGSFLMGVLAGRITKSNKVGFVGGENLEVLERFYSGYVSGVKQVNKEAAEELISRKNSRYTMDFHDVDKAYKAAKELYASGCDIIYQAVGEAGVGVFKAALEDNKLAIGVDQDQGAVFAEYSKVILSSMMKKVDQATYDICQEVATGTFKSGKNHIKMLGLKEGYIDVAPSTKDKISEELMSEINMYKDKIIRKEINIPENLSLIKEYKPDTES